MRSKIWTSTLSLAGEGSQFFDFRYNDPVTHYQRNRALKLSIVDGMLHAIMLGFSESYVGALAVALGHDDVNLGLLATIPIVVGALAQLLSGPAVAVLGGRKRVVVLAAALQACCLLGFSALALAEESRLGPFLVLKCLFWFLASIGVPAWGAWIAVLTEDVERERYFAWRLGFVHLALLAGFSGAGTFLQSCSHHSRQMWGFGVVFAVGTVARGLSSLVLAAQYEPVSSSVMRARSSLQRLRMALAEGHWRSAYYLAALLFAGNLAIPFFTPYMLRTLQLSYGAFTWLMALSVAAKAVSYTFCHRATARVGLYGLVSICGLGVAIVPVLWGLCDGLVALSAIQVASGVAWAGVEFATYQLLLRGAGDEVRLEFLALSASLSAVAQLGGAIIGGQLLDRFQLAYVDLFILSGMCRAVALLVLLGKSRHLRFAGRAWRVFLRPTSIRPTMGASGSVTLAEPKRPDESSSP